MLIGFLNLFPSFLCNDRVKPFPTECKSNVNESHVDSFNEIFTHCRRTLGHTTWGKVLAALSDTCRPDTFPAALRSLNTPPGLPAFIDDLARIEWAWHVIKEDRTPIRQPPEVLSVNPTLTLTPVNWKHLALLIQPEPESPEAAPEPGPAQVMTWGCPKTGRRRILEADNTDLLALKITIEGTDPRDAAVQGGVTVGAIHGALARATDRGILIAPESRIQRHGFSHLKDADPLAPFLRADAFALQWHITQACDLRCKHCYDRSDRPPMEKRAAMAVLEDFYEFCRQMQVRGHVTFTGGNPMLYPHILDVYRAASDYGFSLAILGNPTPIHRIEALVGIAMPAYFQVSLEGLAEHNDEIRGPGHFRRSLDFLDQLLGLGIYTMVMLTLTRDNLTQVLPLGRFLEGRADFFTFNRLSAVGEGASLAMPEPEAFEAFLRRYEAAARKSQILGLKENLINIIRYENGLPPFGGCAGHGCGAAFNFVALLPDGEVHACRKFPSPIGNIFDTSLMDIYNSDRAQRYRQGSSACRNCRLNAICRGCLAVTHSLGLDIHTDKDPFCFASPELCGTM
jgi:selenobiotic family peptide radical SAM maturase